MAFEMPDELKGKLEEVAGELGTFAEEMRGEFEETSETWQQSNKGNDVLTWIDALDDLKDTMDNMDKEPT